MKKQTNTFTALRLLPGPVVEWSFPCELRQDAEIDVCVLREKAGEIRVPAFMDGHGAWRVRLPASEARGTWKVFSGKTCLDGLGGRLEAQLPQPDNELERRGAISLSEDGKHFRHADGTPFFCLADSWWYGMSARLHWPDEFSLLVADRVAKGFTAIQFAIGFPCDIEPFDPRGANETGDPWTPDLARLRPEYFDQTDHRVFDLVRQGLVPMIAGMWGFYLPVLGEERVRRHWREVVARYAALPVIWNLCGESRLVQWTKSAEEKLRHQRMHHEVWPKIAAHIRAIDPWRRPLSVHPGPAVFPDPEKQWRDPIADLSHIDFLTLQPGHSDFDALNKCFAARADIAQRHPKKPFWIGECAWEGMHGGSGPKTQRQLFWSNVLSGAIGHGYGTDSLWQMNRRDNPFGPSGSSPNGHIWGNTPWEDAYKWEGSTHVGRALRILKHFEWWRMKPCPELCSLPVCPENPHGDYAAGVADEFYLIYFPLLVAPWKRHTVCNLAPGRMYEATWWSPITGAAHPIGTIEADADGKWTPSHAPVLHDWVLSLVCKK